MLAKATGRVAPSGCQASWPSAPAARQPSSRAAPDVAAATATRVESAADPGHDVDPTAVEPARPATDPDDAAARSNRQPPIAARPRAALGTTAPESCRLAASAKAVTPIDPRPST